MAEIQILIPKEQYYTMYAEGILLKKETDANSLITTITLNSEYCFFIYYYFNFHRRVYLCTTKTKVNRKRLPTVNQDFDIFLQLRGRGFDRFKSTMDYLNHATMGEVYKLPEKFFWQLGYLCKKGKNDRYNVNELVHRYDFNMEIRKVAWSQKKN